MTDETNQAGAMSALYEALAKAQSGMGALAKDAKGNFGKYATLASVIEVVLPPLSEQGIAVIQMPETSADGMTLITLLCHKAGGVIRTELTMKPAQNTPQGIGSTITYARRYSLMAIAGVAPDDDDGTAGSASTQPAKKNASQVKKGGEYQTFEKAIHAAQNPYEAAVAFSNADIPAWPQSFQDTVKDKLEDAFYASLDLVDPDDIKDWIVAYDEALGMIPVPIAEGIVTEAKRRIAAHRVRMAT
jgi:hypothetical protein